MLALGAYLLVSVAAASPGAPVHAAEKLSSTYDEAFCDPADGGECADEQTLSVDLPPAAPAILDCESPFLTGMIGSCDMPKPAPPGARVATLRNANGTLIVGGDGAHDHLRVVTAGASTDAALSIRGPTLAPLQMYKSLFAMRDGASPDAPLERLDRPPRV